MKRPTRLPNGSRLKYRRLCCRRCFVPAQHALVDPDDPATWPLHRCAGLPSTDPLAPFTGLDEVTRQWSRNPVMVGDFRMFEDTASELPDEAKHQPADHAKRTHLAWPKPKINRR